MSGFHFPPPPPPPPSRRPDQHQVGPRGQSEARGRGRGRGRGTDEYGSRGRGGYGLANDRQRSRGHSHHPATFGAANRTQLPNYSGNSTGNAGYHAQPAAPHLIPPGSHINPAFAGLMTPDGNGFEGNDLTHQQNGRQGHSMHSQSANALPNSTFADSTSPSASTARIPGLTEAASRHSSQKRKLDVYQGSSNGYQTRPLAGRPQNPIVPSFGGPIVRGRQFQTPQPGISGQTRKASYVKNNVLGLTPQDVNPIYSSSESDDDDEIADEEAILAKGLGPGLTFHDVNGEMRTLNSAADLVAWRNARRRNFPTTDRISQKAAEKREIGAERRRLLTGAKEALEEAIAGTALTKNRTSTAQASDDAAHAAKAIIALRNEEHHFAGMDSKAAQHQSWQSLSQAHSTNTPAAFVQSNLRHEEPGELRTQGAGGLGTERRDPRPPHDLSGGAETVSLPAEMECALVVSDADLSDDGPPEEVATKRQPRADTAFIPCKFFAASGYCRDGPGCRFKHEILSQGGRRLKHATSNTPRRDPYAPLLDVPDHNDKKSLHQRLLEREQQDEDKLALQAIKYLGSLNFFAADGPTK